MKELTKADYFNICLVHQPSIWEETFKNIELMFAGHTHKGQIFPFYYFVKLKFKYIYGVYKRNHSTLVVSSGAGTWGPKLRLGSYNEIIKLTIAKDIK